MNVVGNGLMARACIGYAIPDGYLVFASGVSNSLEVRRAQFDREEALLMRTINENPHSNLIYFSTCSLSQDKVTPYTIHKERMETLVQERCARYSIFRFPQVVGVVDNTTLVSYLVRKLVSGKTVTLYRSASRKIIAVADVYRIIEKVLTIQKGENVFLNVSSQHPVNIIDLHSYIAKICGVSSDSTIVDGGEHLEVDLIGLKSMIGEDDPVFEKEYWKRVIEAYVPQILACLETAT